MLYIATESKFYKLGFQEYGLGAPVTTWIMNELSLIDLTDWQVTGSVKWNIHQYTGADG